MRLRVGVVGQSQALWFGGGEGKGRAGDRLSYGKTEGTRSMSKVGVA